MWLFAEKGGFGIGPELDGKAYSLVNRYYRELISETAPSFKVGCIEKAVTFFNEHFTESISIADVAETCGLSHGHFSTIFKLATGKRPVEYLESVRMRNALRLLENTTIALREIAELSGYRNEFYFSRAFKKLFGFAPSIHRQKRSATINNRTHKRM